MVKILEILDLIEISRLLKLPWHLLLETFPFERNIMFQSPIFRCAMLVSERVIVKHTYPTRPLESWNCWKCCIWSFSLSWVHIYATRGHKDDVTAIRKSHEPWNLLAFFFVRKLPVEGWNMSESAVEIVFCFLFLPEVSHFFFTKPFFPVFIEICPRFGEAIFFLGW